MDGLGSPEGLMDPSMMDLRYHGQGTPGCYSPKLSYQPFQPNARTGTQYTPPSLHAFTTFLHGKHFSFVKIQNQI
jgi:hypothetical protein